MKSILSVLNTKHLWLTVLPIALMLAACNTPTVPIEPLLEASVGVYGNCGSSTLGTYFVLRIKNPDGSSIAFDNTKITVVGPTNWGTSDHSITNNDTFPIAFSINKKPVAGEFTLSVPVNGSSISRTMTLTDTTTKPACPIASFQTQTPDELTIALNQTTGLVSYRLSVLEASTSTLKKQSGITKSTSPTLKGLTGVMDATKFNWLELASYNLDFTSETTLLPTRVTKGTRFLPVIVAPVGTGYNMSAAYGTLLDSRYPDQIFTNAVWELKNPDGSSPMFSTFSYGTYPPNGTSNPIGVVNGTENSKPNAVGEQPHSIYTAPIANIGYTTRVLANGQRYEASNTIPDITQTLGFASNVRVTSTTTSSLKVAWNPPVGSFSYEANLYDDANNFIDYKVVNTTSVTLQNFAAPLQVGKTYRLYLYSNNYDRTAKTNLPAQFNTSNLCGRFTFSTPTPETVLTPCPTFNLSKTRSNSSEALSLPSFPSDKVFR
jgi:hypothetical protein